MRLGAISFVAWLALVSCGADSALVSEQKRLHLIMREADMSGDYQRLLEYLNTQYDDPIENMVNETTVRWAHAHREQYLKLTPRLSAARLKGLSDLVERLQRERDDLREKVNTQ